MLVQNPSFGDGIGMSIHIRTKIKSWWSYIEAAAIQIGDHVFEFKGGEPGEDPQYWINGEPGSNDPMKDPNLKALESALAKELKGFKFHYKNVNENMHQFRIDLDRKGDAVKFTSWKDWVEVNVRATNKKEYFMGSAGLMGTYPDGSMMARDGDTLITDTDVFGQEWQVLETEPKLFHNVEGAQHPEKCTMPDMDERAATKQRRLGESSLKKEDAEAACVEASDPASCVYDVLALNDVGVAGAY